MGFCKVTVIGRRTGIGKRADRQIGGGETAYEKSRSVKSAEKLAENRAITEPPDYDRRTATLPARLQNESSPRR